MQNSRRRTPVFFHLPALSKSSPPCRCLPFLLLRSVQSAAQLRKRAPRNPSLHLKLPLLLHEGFSPSQVKILQDDPYFLAASSQRIASLISLLRTKGILGARAGSVLTRAPSILSYTAEGLERKFKFFEDLGIGTPGLQRLLKYANYRSVLGVAIRTSQKHVDFLERIGLDKQDIVKIITKLPKVLLLNVERNMATLTFLQRHGMSKDDVCRLVRSHPDVLSFSIDGYLTEKLEFVRGLGLDIRTRSGARAFSSWISSRSKLLLCKWEFLKREGFSEAQVHKMVKVQPEILAMSENNLKRKIDYVKDGLNRDLQELAKFPAFFGLSLENRIIPRFKYLNELKEKGEDVKARSLSALLVPSDEIFAKKYATGYAEWKARYNNKEAGEG